MHMSCRSTAGPPSCATMCEAGARWSGWGGGGGGEGEVQYCKTVTFLYIYQRASDVKETVIAPWEVEIEANKIFGCL